MEAAVRTIERIAAFIPGASPPLVSTPIVFITFHLTKKEQSYPDKKSERLCSKYYFVFDRLVFVKGHLAVHALPQERHS